MIEQRTASSVIKDASAAIKGISGDEEYRSILRQREKAEHDEISALRFAMAEGRAEGRAETGSEVAARLKAMGMPDEKIREILKGLI